MKRLLSAVLVFLMLQTQFHARANQGSLDSSFNRLADQIGNGGMKSADIVASARQMVGEALEAGVTETEFLNQMSAKLALNMSEDEVTKTIEDLRQNRSEGKINQLALALEKTQSGDKFLMVLITFALMSALLIGIFFMIADPHYPR